ncbi:uncharacterized protein K489DRAFT_30183 [Dissoconium aciculare CBS 342.82]|uniref:Uncharacterized protein n=1 Tax=Dissoconium aciculare CBS 342.82 TaxID=1314786 RepID=A0A6J3MLJ3_9PEZI|nr:uncharacterized protein K489DRAFT_30183 [Dissoconium aciculare CBS 342.82]KAF1827862.1 hypothetical protein K489DRAFT_30183 [Dissoconium aciculare CBS 342.82]
MLLRSVRGCRSSRGLTADPGVQACKRQSATHQCAATVTLPIFWSACTSVAFLNLYHGKIDGPPSPTRASDQRDADSPLPRLACFLYPHIQCSRSASQIGDGKRHCAVYMSSQQGTSSHASGAAIMPPPCF